MRSGKKTDIFADGLRQYPARLKTSTGWRQVFWKLAGTAVAVLSVLPFVSGAAKASVQNLGLRATDNPAALQDIAAGKYHGIQVAGHTDVPHHNTNPHGDHTDPWGNHVDVSEHANSEHVNTTSDDSGSEG